MAIAIRQNGKIQIGEWSNSKIGYSFRTKNTLWDKIVQKNDLTVKFSLDDCNVILDQICKNTRINRTRCHGNGKRWIGTSSLAQGNTTLFRLPVSFDTLERYFDGFLYDFDDVGLLGE